MDELDIKQLQLFIFKRTCLKCHHDWFPRSGNPQRCPRCQVWLEKLADGKEMPKINEMPTGKTQ